ncbi:WD40 repeat-like protein [Tilletiopsis washingtonensis]|uniref:Pre-mRNA-splicing factor PRP46 n=1 Tax=Tilletiopsis washingtonensis TaxID=58919 RepID=A0A316Z196_9BASI|nr:WD40 repeat-like protein [Tilletiopsis washingtonensis]PWN94854.1 WD40 repeat-like protein [Tilletiopsis washingtonensis]
MADIASTSAVAAPAPPAPGESSASPAAVPTPDLAHLLSRSAKRTKTLFSTASPLPSFLSDSAADLSGLEESHKAKLATLIAGSYADAKVLPAALLAQQRGVGPAKPGAKRARVGEEEEEGAMGSYISDIVSRPASAPSASASAGVVALRRAEGFASSSGGGSTLNSALIRRKDLEARKAAPKHHAQWKLSRVISGHLGWVRAIAMDPENKWFVTGAGDRMIKIWDLASGELKLSLTGHISTVRGLAVSSRHPYLFSAGEDKMVKCWDLETNKVIRQYHGHLSGIYSLSLHPTLDVLVTAGRDASARVWDMRTKAQVHVLSGHRGTVASVQCQDSDPQVVTGSMDSTIRLWDLAAGKSLTTLTHHKKSVRALAIHPQEFTFASGSAGGRNVKTWKFPEGTLINNMSTESIVNTLSINPDGVLFSGADNGALNFFDYATGTPFQSSLDIPQPGSLDAEAGVFCSTFDHTGTRLLTGGADKTIKMYKEV